MSQQKLNTSIAIIGVGDVGAAIAYALLLNPVAHDIILVDLNDELLEAQVADLGDATYRGNSGVRVKKGDFKEAGQADIVVVTAGAKQKKDRDYPQAGKSYIVSCDGTTEGLDEGINAKHAPAVIPPDREDRISLLSRNLSILHSIFSSMQPINPDTVLLLVANPVDILTHFARQISGLPANQVLGTGTSLDSARLRGRLARELEVAPNSVNAFVLGEHGDSQFVHWSAITIGTSPLPLLHPLSPEFKSTISSEVASAAGNIIAAKGCTNFGIGNIAASICKYILSDQRTVRPVSYYQEDLGVTLSMPAVIGRKGIVRPVKVELDEEERGKLEESAKGMREVVKKAEGELEKIQEEAEEKGKGKEGK